jgi:hypothetical protein
MKIIKEVNRELEIEVVDTNNSRVKLMYAKWSDQKKFTHAYVWNKYVPHIIKNMISTDIPHRIVIKNDLMKKDDYKATWICAISSDIDPSEYAHIVYFGNNNKVKMWEPKKFGKEFPKDHVIFAFSGYNAISYDLNGVPHATSRNISEWGIDRSKVKELASTVDWLEVIDDEYYVPGNGTGMILKVWFTSDEILKSYGAAFSMSSFHGICKLKDIDYNEYKSPRNEYEE